MFGDGWQEGGVCIMLCVRTEWETNAAAEERQRRHLKLCADGSVGSVPEGGSSVVNTDHSSSQSSPPCPHTQTPGEDTPPAVAPPHQRQPNTGNGFRNSRNERGGTYFRDSIETDRRTQKNGGTSMRATNKKVKLESGFKKSNASSKHKHGVNTNIKKKRSVLSEKNNYSS